MECPGYTGCGASKSHPLNSGCLSINTLENASFCGEVIPEFFRPDLGNYTTPPQVCTSRLETQQSDGDIRAASDDNARRLSDRMHRVLVATGRPGSIFRLLLSRPNPPFQRVRNVRSRTGTWVRFVSAAQRAFSSSTSTSDIRRKSTS